MNKITTPYYTTKQGRLPIFISEFLDISDSVLVFDRLMEEINIEQYLKKPAKHTAGRKGYNSVKMLKTILFGFSDEGYISLRKLEENCKVNLRYMYLMDNETPSYRTFGNFINDELSESIEKHLCCY